MKFVERIVSLCSGAPIAVAALCVALGAGSGLYTSAEFNMDTDSTKLISDQVGWRVLANTGAEYGRYLAWTMATVLLLDNPDLLD